ncbi:MAG: pilus assembly protein PilP [Deltaproteobacteria bacterium]|nr:pilus assembly protein PilP [Deltaproteobacteria bacterium]
MLKHKDKIRVITCLICFLLFVCGCGDKKSDVQQSSSVVSKKIAVQQQTSGEIPKAPAKAAETIAPVKPDAGQNAEGSDEPSIPATPDLVQENILAKAATGYDPKGKIDPFVPLIREEAPKKKNAVEASKTLERKKRKPTTPLERIDLSQLSLRAIIRSAEGNKALVEEASGKGYIITKGTYIGVNQGTVIDIQKDRVVVEEEVESIQGDVTLKTRELRLPKPSGEE